MDSNKEGEGEGREMEWKSNDIKEKERDLLIVIFEAL